MKALFDYCVKVDWNEDNKNIKTITEYFGVSKEDVFCLLKIYAISYLGITEKEWKRKKVGGQYYGKIW